MNDRAIRPLRMPRRTVVRLQDRRSDAGLKIRAARKLLLAIDPAGLSDEERARLSEAMAACARHFDPFAAPPQATRH
jgi:hypothetical protein